MDQDPSRNRYTLTTESGNFESTHKETWRDHLPVCWASRGLGLDVTNGCFVCGATRRTPEQIDSDYMNNIAAHVAKVDEFAAMACFERGARMDYYHGDRESPQIKVGACNAHLPELEALSNQWFISFERVFDLARWGKRRVEWEAENESNGKPKRN